MPMRPEISGLDRAAARAGARQALGLDPDRPTLIVTGGSSGAQSINRTLAAAVGALADAGVQTLHITGRGKSVHDADGKPLAAPGYRQVEYVDGMETVYAAADLLLARCRRRHGLRGGRRRRARRLRSAAHRQRRTGAERRRASSPREAPCSSRTRHFSADWVREHIIPLLQDPDRLARMAASAEQLGIRDADRRMADLILEVASAAAQRNRSSRESTRTARQEAVEQ